MKYTKKICLLAGTVLMSCALLWGCGSGEKQKPAETVTIPAVSDGKQPSEYTWEEYQAMTEEEQLEFQKKFGSQEVFEAWLDAAMLADTEQELADAPWKNGGKQPSEYTWEEFEALSGPHQIAFQKELGEAGFEAWLNGLGTQSQPEEYPWDEPGAKQPEEYTWEEFEALTGGHQIAFQNVLGQDAFEAWMEQALRGPVVYPWDEPGAKLPEEYTWEEFEALSGDQQIAFQNVLGQEAFEAWLTENMP